MEKRVRILVVAEAKTKGDELRYLLEGEGYQIDHARSAIEAVTQIDREPFDLILAEIPAPDMESLDLLQCIREAAPSTPLIVMGGDAAFETAIEAWQYDITGYIAQPLQDPAKVLAAVTGALTDRKERGSRLAGHSILDF